MEGNNKLKIHRIPLRLSNAFVVLSARTTLLIDTGMPGEAQSILKQIRRLGNPELGWIFLTHAHLDHVGSVAELRRETGAKVLIQAEDAPQLMQGKTLLGEVRGRGRLTAWMLPLIERILPVEGIEPDLVFTDQFRIPDQDLEILAIHTPGHTKGSSSLLVEKTHLFAGDLISTTGSPHPQRYYAHNWEALRSSLDLIQSLKPTCTYPGHGRKKPSPEKLLDLSI